jgi:hypothetical protein
MRTLEGIRSKAKQYGYGGLEFEARLRMAQLEFSSGNANSGRARMELLREDAQSRGFLLVARQASNALQPKSLRASAKAKS